MKTSAKLIAALCCSLWSGPVLLAAVLPTTTSFDKDVIIGNAEDGMNTTESLLYYGYPAEAYSVITPDGYILLVDRIPYGRNDPKPPDTNNTGRPMVFLQHGLLAASDCWLWNGPDDSLGMILADAGYDVWMGNFRGNKYSTRHIMLPITSRAFWTFSFDEMGHYDLPTMVSFALNATNQKQLILIAHSEGTTASVVALQEADQKFAQYIKVFAALAPAVYFANVQSPFIRAIAPWSRDLDALFLVIGYNDFQPSNWFTRWIADHVCDKAVFGEICQQFMYMLGGYDKPEYNASRADVYFSHFPAGTSSQNMAHFGQGVDSRDFAMFDWGSARDNLYHYGTSEPPVYVPGRIQRPVGLFHAQNDWLAPLADVNTLKAELSSSVVVLDYIVPLPTFNHFDFVLAIDARFFVYNKLLDFISVYR